MASLSDPTSYAPPSEFLGISRAFQGSPKQEPVRTQSQAPQQGFFIEKVEKGVTVFVLSCPGCYSCSRYDYMEIRTTEIPCKKCSYIGPLVLHPDVSTLHPDLR